jgi:hypothetical protein
MSNYDNGSKGLSKIALGFIGTFLSLLFAFIAKDYLCKAGYIWVTQTDTQKNYSNILKNVVDDDVHRRVRSADSLPNVDNKNQPTSIKEHLRMQSLLNNLEPIEKIIKE